MSVAVERITVLAPRSPLASRASTRRVLLARAESSVAADAAIFFLFFRLSLATSLAFPAQQMGRIIRGQRKGAGSVFTSNTSKRKGAAKHRQSVSVRRRRALATPARFPRARAAKHTPRRVYD